MPHHQAFDACVTCRALPQDLDQLLSGQQPHFGSKAAADLLQRAQLAWPGSAGDPGQQLAAAATQARDAAQRALSSLQGLPAVSLPSTPQLPPLGSPLQLPSLPDLPQLLHSVPQLPSVPALDARLDSLLGSSPQPHFGTRAALEGLQRAVSWLATEVLQLESAPQLQQSAQALSAQLDRTLGPLQQQLGDLRSSAGFSLSALSSQLPQLPPAPHWQGGVPTLQSLGVCLLPVQGAAYRCA